MTQENLLLFFQKVEAVMWGWPMLILLVFTGFYLTFLLKGIQFRYLFRSLFLAFASPHNKKSAGDISHFQALMTALSATVGTGNIAGVATAVSFGGPGALVWMWLTGFLGMATKFSEAVLGVYYRRREDNGEMSGGPMYYIQDGLNHYPPLKKFHIPKVLGGIFAFLIVIAALNIGNMVQANSVADAVSNGMRETNYAQDGIKLWVGIVMAILTGLVVVGGIKRIGRVASAMVPFMILVYVCAGLFILLTHWQQIDDVFVLIFESAFSDIGRNAAGGFLGVTVKEVMKFGLSRGVFSNESGLGTAPIAAAAAKTPHPVEQALVSMTQTFIDTIVVCTFTGLIIILSGLWWVSDPNELTGAALTAQAFGEHLSLPVFTASLGEVVVAMCLIFFAYSTVIGWYYYGEKGLTYLVGTKGIWPYRIVFLCCLVFGAVQPVPLIWTIATVLIGFMIFPNLLSLLLLSKQVKRLTADFIRNEKTGEGYLEKPFYHIHEAR